MNRIVLIFVFVFAISFNIKAKDIRESQVPAEVKAYVEKHYPAAGYKEWNYKNKNNTIYYYKVEFEVNGREVKLERSPNGKLISSKEELETKDIPAFISNYVEKNYPEAYLLSVKRKEDRGRIYYDAGIRYRNSWGNTRHRNIHFNSNGELMKF